MSVQHLLSDNSVSLSYNGKFRVFPSGDAKYAKIVEFIKNKDDKGLIDFLDSNDNLITNTYKEFEVKDGLAFINGEALPRNLSDRLVKFAEQKLDCKPLINFWNRLKKNPSARAVRELFTCLDNNHHPIYPDGTFMAWKSVRDNFKDIHSGKYENKPGAIHSVNRNEVDDDYTRECSFGFHVGSYQYATTWSGMIAHVMEVRVDPADVVRVPQDSQFQKMGVCKYEVVRECTEFTASQVVEDSDYEDDDDYYPCDYCYDDACDGECMEEDDDE